MGAGASLGKKALTGKFGTLIDTGNFGNLGISGYTENAILSLIDSGKLVNAGYTADGRIILRWA